MKEFKKNQTPQILHGVTHEAAAYAGRNLRSFFWGSRHAQGQGDFSPPALSIKLGDGRLSHGMGKNF